MNKEIKGFQQINYTHDNALELNDFKEMDYFAVNNYNLPIELMMENAGLQLANLIADCTEPNQIIKIGIGNGNNGGGGLVAARRLLAWGYTVYLDLITDINKELPKKQLERAMSFGAKLSTPSHCDVWVDAYLGFSQKLPLSNAFLERCYQANDSSSLKISLDIPTGFLGNINSVYFECDKVITLAAPKKILYNLPESTEVYVSDLGIPTAVYTKFGIVPLDFNISNIFQLVREEFVIIKHYTE